MSRKRSVRWMILWAAASLAVLLSCSLPFDISPPGQGTGNTPTKLPNSGIIPTITNHPPIVLPGVDASPFIQAGCTKDSSWMRCPAEGAFKESACTAFYEGDNLGGLGAPVLLCLEATSNRNVPASEYLYNDGCSRPAYVRYILNRNGKMSVIKNLEGMQAAFSPVDTPEKALSYAIAVTGYFPSYGLKFDKSYRYAVSQIEDTNIKDQKGSFLVHLFYTKDCGCGPHPTYAADVTVSRDGSFQAQKLGEQFANPKYDDMCVD